MMMMSYREVAQLVSTDVFLAFKVYFIDAFFKSIKLCHPLRVLK